MALAQAARRPIEGAVATLGVSDRVNFLRKTYAHLGVSLLIWAAATGYVFRYMQSFSLHFTAWALQMSWLVVMALLIGSGMLARWLASSQTSRALQYLGLGIMIGSWTLLMQIMLNVLFLKGNFAHPMSMLGQGVTVTMFIFVGLTLTVFITKKDFSFLRGIVTVGSFAAIGIIAGACIFGFSLGLVFVGALIALLALRILYETSTLMNDWAPTEYVAASLMLFATVATLFWNVMVFLMKLNRR